MLLLQFIKVWGGTINVHGKNQWQPVNAAAHWQTLARQKSVAVLYVKIKASAMPDTKNNKDITARINQYHHVLQPHTSAEHFLYASPIQY